ncbi:MAG: hypothetical protein CM1200mP16_09350 [Nitrospina sp.]|nr:MAG: hypothetical protein CM1200mP16_09350 [Nitrospina sp.]
MGAQKKELIFFLKTFDSFLIIYRIFQSTLLNGTICIPGKLPYFLISRFSKFKPQRIIAQIRIRFFAKASGSFEGDTNAVSSFIA